MREPAILEQEPLDVRVHVPAPTVAEVRVIGAVDLVTAPVLRERVAFHLAHGRHAVVDLRDVAVLDASGLDVLRALAGSARAAGVRLHLTNADVPAVAGALAPAGLDTVLPVSTSSTEELVAALAHPRRTPPKDTPQP